MSSYSIMLTFEDGLKISLSEALEQQMITMPDLILNGLQGLIIESINR